MTSCTYCDSQRVVPVMDKRMTDTVRQWGGNRFRRYCLVCRKFGTFCSREEWETHPDARVLPPDADPDDPELLDANGEEYDNQFVCPSDGCDAVHEGYPDGCEVCGTDYDWSHIDD